MSASLLCDKRSSGATLRGRRFALERPAATDARIRRTGRSPVRSKRGVRRIATGLSPNSDHLHYPPAFEQLEAILQQEGWEE